MKSEYISFWAEGDMKDWLEGGPDSKGKKIRKIIKWCMESYQDYYDLKRLIKK